MSKIALHFQRCSGKKNLLESYLISLKRKTIFHKDKVQNQYRFREIIKTQHGLTFLEKFDVKKDSRFRVFKSRLMSHKILSYVIEIDFIRLAIQPENFNTFSSHFYGTVKMILSVMIINFARYGIVSIKLFSLQFLR